MECDTSDDGNNSGHTTISDGTPGTVVGGSSGVPQQSGANDGSGNVPGSYANVTAPAYDIDAQRQRFNPTVAGPYPGPDNYRSPQRKAFTFIPEEEKEVVKNYTFYDVLFSSRPAPVTDYACPPGFEDCLYISRHGYPSGWWSKEDGFVDDPKEIAKTIRNIPQFYVNGEPPFCIVLAACNTGKEVDGKPPIAAKLAKELGIPIIAPSAFAVIGHPGSTYLSTCEGNKCTHSFGRPVSAGSWYVFYPNGTKDYFSRPGGWENKSTVPPSW